MRCDLYRIFNADGDLLYIGISFDALTRLAQHRGKSWFPEHPKVVVQTFDTEAEAKAAERTAIKTEHPKHNIVHAIAADRRRERATVSDQQTFGDLDEWIKYQLDHAPEISHRHATRVSTILFGHA